MLNHKFELNLWSHKETELKKSRTIFSGWATIYKEFSDPSYQHNNLQFPASTQTARSAWCLCGVGENSSKWALAVCMDDRIEIDTLQTNVRVKTICVSGYSIISVLSNYISKRLKDKSSWQNGQVLRIGYLICSTCWKTSWRSPNWEAYLHVTISLLITEGVNNAMLSQWC